MPCFPDAVTGAVPRVQYPGYSGRRCGMPPRVADRSSLEPGGTGTYQSHHREVGIRQVRMEPRDSRVLRKRSLTRARG